MRCMDMDRVMAMAVKEMEMRGLGCSTEVTVGGRGIMELMQEKDAGYEQGLWTCDYDHDYDNNYDSGTNLFGSLIYR